MGGYVAFGDVRSLALWERLGFHGQRARVRYPIPWYRGSARAFVADPRDARREGR